MTTNTDELLDRLHEGVGAILDDDRWTDALRVAGKFYHYSANNRLAIWLQCPEATRVAGFRRWQELGRQVRKGEKGIAILAPCIRRTKADSSSESDANSENNTDSGEHGRRRGAGELAGVRIAHVFDYAQTDGDPLPQPPAPVLVDGGAPAAMWQQLATQITGHGYRIERGDCGGANGWANHTTHTVRIVEGLPPAQACKTLAHELAHIECGHLNPDAAKVDRKRAEVEAESVAYLLGAVFGLDTGGYTFPYVAGWAQTGDRNTTLAAVREAFEAVCATHRRILGRFEDAGADLAGEE